MLDTTKREIGVKTEKITISKEIRYCKPLILKGLQKKSQKISTHLLTVLISGAILYSNKREREKSRRYLLLFSINTSDLNRLCKSIFKYLLKGDMTYDDA